MNLDSLNISEKRELIKSGELGASDLADACYRQIERLNPTLNAFITVIPPRVEETPSTGYLPLQGIPVAVKDLYNTKGIRSTGGSKFFADHIPNEDAFV
ncbi:MAG: amidase, partial [Anaerolineae bacterium]|nr:amidase [Anaerolineae bacterium]